MTAPDNSIIAPIAAGFANTYRMVDRSDIAQELSLWWVQNSGKVVAWTADPDDKIGQGKLLKSLRNAAARYCRAEKAQKAGYRTTDEFFYDLELVRVLIGYVWHPERITQEQRQQQDGQPRNPRPAHEGNNLLAMVSDIASAVGALGAEPVKVLYLRYGADLTYDDIGARLGLGPEVKDRAHLVEMRVSRALEKVVESLGGRSPWTDGPGSRRVLSNAAAQAVTRNQETR